MCLRMQPVPLTGTVTLAGDMDLLFSYRMQPVPLTGTVTPSLAGGERLAYDAARTPHGDSNLPIPPLQRSPLMMQPVPLTGTVTKNGAVPRSTTIRMQPVPLTGTVTKCSFPFYISSISDAARTPHGDSNLNILTHNKLLSRCSPYPSRGQQRFSCPCKSASR